MIRVVVMDDHPAMRAGLRAVLEAAPDLEPVGEAGSGRDLWPVLERVAPDVVLLDFHMREENGLLVCRRIKRRPPAPRVVIYSAYADESLVAPARLAGADALVAKSAPSTTLAEAIRDAAEGRTSGPDPAQVLAALEDDLDPAERRLVERLLAGAPAREVAAAGGIQPGELEGAIERVLRRVVAARLAPV